MNAKRYSKPVYRVLLVLSAALLAFSMMFSHVPVSAPAKAETTVAADINAITDGSVYRLTEDMTDDLTINADANVRIDLAGHIMSGKIVNNGTLVLIDSEGSGGVIRENINVETNLVTNKGDLTVDGAKISAVGTKVIRTIDNQAGAVLRDRKSVV